jgi:uncharacterized protein YegP (UPF0339 family)
LVVTATGAADEPSSGAHFQIYGASPRSPLRWRLLSGNNRDIGRGVDEFPTPESCHEAIASLRKVVGEMEVVLKRIGHEWTWQLVDGDAPVVIAGHNYDRKIRCERALDQFVQRAASAPTSPKIMLSATRRWTAGPSSRLIMSTRLATDRVR